MSALLNICLPQSLGLFGRDGRTSQDTERAQDAVDLPSPVSRQELMDLFQDHLQITPHVGDRV